MFPEVTSLGPFDIRIMLLSSSIPSPTDVIRFAEKQQSCSSPGEAMLPGNCLCFLPLLALHLSLFLCCSAVLLHLRFSASGLSQVKFPPSATHRTIVVLRCVGCASSSRGRECEASHSDRWPVKHKRQGGEKQLWRPGERVITHTPEI